MSSLIVEDSTSSSNSVNYASTGVNNKYSKLFPEKNKGESSLTGGETSPRATRGAVSFDSASFTTQKSRSASSKRRKASSKRSHSSSETSHFMSPLTFENIDLVNTPLSSLRSCSEYNRMNSLREMKRNQQEASLRNQQNKRPGLWSKLTGWYSHNEGSNGSQTAGNDGKKSKLKVNHYSSEQDNAFYVERLRFNEANLTPSEKLLYRRTNESRDASLYGLDSSSTSRAGASSGRSISGVTSTLLGRGSKKNSHYQNNSARSSFLYETSVAVDYIFGYPLHPRHNGPPMEIELKNLKAPQTISVYSGTSALSEHDRDALSDRDSTVRRISGGLMTYETVTTDNAVVEPALPTIESAIPTQLDVTDSATWTPYLMIVWRNMIAYLRERFPPSEGDDLFYESIRLQPFSAGAYLRGMLLAGLSSLSFQTYNVITWPLITEPLTPIQISIKTFMYTLLLIQVGMNVLQLPCRVRIHFLCWESSKAVEIDGAISILRSMLQSDSWFLNRLMGRTLDCITLLMLLLTEIYLYGTNYSDPLRNVIVSLCATNMLTVVCRVVVATCFSLSMHDPHVLSEARKRGVSKYDLEKLPTFVFSKPQDCNNSDCSICLCDFDMGEMLTCLPCDRKHSFHSACIRQWLQRQNSCPLCQKMV